MVEIFERSQFLSDISDSFLKTPIFCISLCVEFIQLAYLHRYLSSKFNRAPSNEILVIDALHIVKTLTEKVF